MDDGKVPSGLDSCVPDTGGARNGSESPVTLPGVPLRSAPRVSALQETKAASSGTEAGLPMTAATLGEGFRTISCLCTGHFLYLHMLDEGEN